ncbi:MAG TPA: hypothetical protein VK631_12185, partial [Solirubrobacteraceae bacterium]|nr:hypothetical protein [Solirubrobacteraceae bacterium]
FAAQSGKQAAETRTMTVAGCTPPPRASARITRLRTGRPTVRFTVTAAPNAPELRQVRLRLPDALRTQPKRAPRGVRATTGAGRLAQRASSLTRGALLLTLPPATRTITATLSKGTVRVSRKIARAKKPKAQSLRITVIDADGPRPSKTLKLRPRRR